MRKRAQRKSRPTTEEHKYVPQYTKPVIEKKPSRMKKKWWIAVALVGVFFLVIFLNTYFNLTSDIAINPEAEGFDKFYLSGPDPYYNLRLVKETYETGEYPYFHEPDPLLNYPIGARGARAPLFNMMALGFSRVLTPFMPETEAIGYSMQFVPALFGALLIFVVYFIGKELFNRKAGLIGAFFIAVIPIHIGSGHGSAYALFDHDSFNLLLFSLTFLFLIKSIKEEDSTKSFLYAILGGIPLAGLSMTWVEAHYLYAIIAIYAIVQMFIDIFTSKINSKFFVTITTLLFSGYLISLPVVSLTPEGFVTNTALYLCLAVAIFGAIYYLFGKLKTPWTISLPAIFSVGAIGLSAIYFSEVIVDTFPFLSPIGQLREAVFGLGIYGNKVSMTIAEANTYQISHTVMSFGPAIYWIGWLGLIYLFYLYYKNKVRREYLFIIVLFLMNLWLSSIAGRFINDMVPVIAVLAGWIVWMFVEWVDYKQMIRNIRRAGGGFHGIRRGVKFLHIFGILFAVFIVVLPNAFVAFDAAIPNTPKLKDDGENYTSLKGYMFNDDAYQGAFGMGIVKEKYWGDALDWLNQQDTDIEDPAQRPAFISWWDYGFYEVALGGHPTVADNFQDGISVAANFHTATSEKEAVSVWVIRLLEGIENQNNGKLTDDVIEVLRRHLGEENSAKIALWMDSFRDSPSYGDPIGAEYDAETSKQYTVGQQYPINAVYHDVVALLDETLDDDGITWLYHDIQEATGWSIRYYGVEGYDRQIFNIFAFLSDKSLLMVNGIADDFIELIYNGYTVDSQGNKVADKSWKADEILDLSRDERAKMVVTGTSQVYKDPYFETMFYKTYIGPARGESGSKQEFDWQVPCLDMKHFYAEFFSDLSEYPYFDTGKAAVVIAKYYEGALINGTVTFMGKPLDCEIVVQKNVTYYPGLTVPIDHDKDTTNTEEDGNGEFNVIVGANAYLQIRRILGQGSFVYDNVTFEGLNGTDLATITDDDAMRRDNSNYERFLNITIEPAYIEGYVFNDTDYDGIYNASIDEPLPDLNMAFYEITNFGEESVDLDLENATYTPTNESGYFNASDMLPGIYRLLIEDKDGFVHHFNDVALYQGNNTYYAVNVQEANLEGVVYYDENSDGEYNSGDTIVSDADIELTHIANTAQGPIQTTIGTTKTLANGSYTFKSLIPGVINKRDLNIYSLKVKHAEEGYETEVTVSIVENETTIFNVSVGLRPVTVSGTVTYDGAPIGGTDISFDPDGTVEDNTAELNSTSTGDDGSYEISLSPGTYNITLGKEENSVIVYYFDGDKIILERAQVTDSRNFVLEKASATVTGITSFEGSNIAKISISFTSDGPTAPITTLSDESGSYSIELAPGNYTVNVGQRVTEDDQNYTYTFTGSLEIKTAPSDITYDIEMAKEAED